MVVDINLNADQAAHLLRQIDELVRIGWGINAALWASLLAYLLFEGVRLVRLILAHRRWERAEADRQATDLERVLYGRRAG